MENLIQTENNLPKKDLAELKVEIKFHLGQMGLHAVEIGRLLIEAKAQVGHGEWYKWLEENFNLKERSARNFMEIAERFGNRQSIADLNYTQMVQMLALPEGEEEKFIAAKIADGKPFEDTTIKELREEVKQWKEKFHKKDFEIDDLSSQVKNIKQEKFDLENKFKQLEVSNYANENLVKSLQGERDELQKKLDSQEPIEKIVEKIPEDYEPTKKELAELKEKISELENKPIEVATEKPADYESNKKELAELKAKYEELSEVAAVVHTLDTISEQVSRAMYSPLFVKASAYYKKYNPVDYSKLVARVKNLVKILTEDDN